MLCGAVWRRPRTVSTCLHANPHSAPASTRLRNTRQAFQIVLGTEGIYRWL